MTLQELTTRFQLPELHQIDDLEALMAYDAANSYALDQNGQLIGLNLRSNGLGDDLMEALSAVHTLQALNLSENQLTAVKVPESWQSMQFLNLSRNERLTTIQFEAALADLRDLNLKNNQLEFLRLPAGFGRLKKLEGQKNKLKRIVFEGACPDLELLDLSENQLGALDLPAGFDSLKYLYLMGNLLEELKTESPLLKLDTLHLRKNKIATLEDHFLDDFPEITSLYLSENPLPVHVLAEIENDNTQNCKEIIERYLKAMKGKKVLDNVSKVILIGNGGVGKTTFIDRLKGKPLKEKHEPTHAIQLYSYPFKDYQFNFWDFAGQDIYHATHRMFMQRDAIYLLFWNWQDWEKSYHIVDQQAGEARQYTNYDLSYWIDYAISQGKDSPIILVQTRAAESQGKSSHPPIESAYAEKKQYFGAEAIESNDSDNGRNGYNVLLEKILDTIKKTKEEVYMPANYDQLRKKLEALHQKGTEKKISIEKYLELAAEAKVEEPLKVLSGWLTKAGIVFYSQGLFNNDIILDQEWAIQAVYSILNPEATYYNFRRQDGSFSGADLSNTVWKELSDSQKELLISMMKDCEICFETTADQENSWRVPFNERTFAAPELMSEIKPRRGNLWSMVDSYFFEYHHPFIHEGVIFRFIVRTEELAHRENIWKYGTRLEYKDNQTALIEANKKYIRIRISRNSLELLDKVRTLLEKELMPELQLAEKFVSLDGQDFVSLNEIEQIPAAVDIVKLRDEYKYVKVEPYLVFTNKGKQDRTANLNSKEIDDPFSQNKHKLKETKRLLYNVLSEKPQLSAFFEELNKKILDSGPSFSTIIMTKRRYKQLEHDRTIGVVDERDYEKTSNQITHACIKLIKDLKEEDLK